MAGKTRADIDLFVPHQANLRINEFVARKLEIPMEKVSRPSTATATPRRPPSRCPSARPWPTAARSPGSLVLFAAFGSGYTWGAGVVRL
jgi:3-oxoacyl-[acyl-carrier-protein] synthase-3